MPPIRKPVTGARSTIANGRYRDRRPRPVSAIHARQQGPKLLNIFSARINFERCGSYILTATLQII